MLQIIRLGLLLALLSPFAVFAQTPAVAIVGDSVPTPGACPAPPSAPNTPSPANSATGVSTTPTLTWVGSNTANYDVYFGTASTPPFVVNTVSASYVPGALTNSTQYFFKIVAHSSNPACSPVSSGSPWSFTTAAGAAPGTPANPSPSTGSTGWPTSGVTLTFTASGATSYSILGPDTTNPPTTNRNLGGTASFTTGTLTAGQTYFWQATGTNGSGSTQGVVWSFQISSGTQTLVSQSDIVFKGLAQMSGFMLPDPNTQMSVRCLNSSNSPVRCTDAAATQHEVFFLGYAHAPNFETAYVGAVTGANATSGTFSVSQGSLPAVNQWIYFGTGQQRWAAKVTNVSGSTLTWTPALAFNADGTYNVSGSVFAPNGMQVYTELQLLYSCVLPSTANLASTVAAAVSGNVICGSGTVTAWGDPYKGARVRDCGGFFCANNIYTFGTMYVDDGSNDILFTTDLEYSAQTWIPSLIRAHLDDNTKTISFARSWYMGCGATGGTSCISSVPTDNPPNPGAYFMGGALPIPDAWCSANLSGATGCVGFYGIYTSGHPQMGGTNLMIVKGADMPVLTGLGGGTGPVNTTGTAIPSYTAVGFSQSDQPVNTNRFPQPRDTNYIANWGVFPWEGTSSNSTSSSFTFTEIAGVQDTGTSISPGSSVFPTKIYWCDNANCNNLVGFANVVSHTSTTINYNTQTGSPLANGYFIFDGSTQSNPWTPPRAVKRSVNSASDWVDFQTIGVGTPTHGYYSPYADGTSNSTFIYTTNRASLLAGGVQCNNSRWYGPAYNDGSDNVDPTSLSQGGNCQTNVPTWQIWKPSDLAGVLAGANTWSISPVSSFDPRNQGFISAVGNEAESSGRTSPKPNSGPMWSGPEFADSTKTMIIVMAPNANTNGCPGSCPGTFGHVIEVFWIPK